MTSSTPGGHHNEQVHLTSAAESEVSLDEDMALGSATQVATLDAPLRELYATYSASVWRGLERLGVPYGQLEDAVQDVFLVVHRRLREFEGRSTLKTWLYGIVLRVAKDHRRTVQRHNRRLDRLARWLSSDAGCATNPALLAEQREASQLLQTVLATLPDEEREMFVLVEFEGLTTHEASDVLGIRLRTGQRRLQAALTALSSAVALFLRDEGRLTT